MNPAWGFLLVDLRGHGDSHGASGPHNLSSCAQDIQNLCTSLNLRPSVAWGHSFGGKVVLRYAENHGSDLRQVWVLDTPFDATPEGIDIHGQSVGLLIKILGSVPMPCLEREDALNPIRKAGFPEMICQWMTTNLMRCDGGFRWRFDLDVIGSLYVDYHVSDMWSAVLGDKPNTGFHLVYGGKSDRWNAENMGRARALEARGTLDIHPMHEAGHWVHVDDPEGLRRILNPWLKRLDAQ